MTSNNVTNTDRDEWYTPPTVIEAARTAMGGIDLDPASCSDANKVVRARTWWAASDLPLERKWAGNVWLNPPYGQQQIRQFYWHAIAQAVTFCILCPLSPSQHAWHLMRNADCVCFLDTNKVRGWHGPSAAGKDPRGPYRLMPLVVGMFRVDDRHHAAASFAPVGVTLMSVTA